MSRVGVFKRGHADFGVLGFTFWGPFPPWSPTHWEDGEAPIPQPLPASVGCFALGTACLQLCSGEAKIKTVTPLQTENRAFLLRPRALDGHQKPKPCCKVPCVKTICYSDPRLAAARRARDVQFPDPRSGGSEMGFAWKWKT